MTIAGHLNGFKRFGLMMTAAVLLAGMFIGYVQPADTANAADGKNMNAGNIIDDAVFYNSSTMSASDIQNFLNAKLASCNSGYTCLKDYSTATNARSADNYCSGYNAGAQKAADIIYGVAKSCGINPQVLLVVLQKESGLITKKNPTEGSYRAATGMGCPDTAACDTKYYGLFNQLYGTARAFKVYQASPKSYNYIAGRSNSVLWHPNSACGRTNIYIENQATAGLYNYTPYAPNQAALNSGYGTGDSCSSYGNRNFWLFFTDWFGSTQKTIASTYLPNGEYYIVSVLDTNKAVGFPGGSMSNSAQLKVFSKASNATLTSLARNSDGSYELRNSESGKLLDVPNGNMASGQVLQQYSSNGTEAQKWNIFNNNNGTYTLSPKSMYGLAIDVAGGVANDETYIQLYNRNSTAAQQFYLTPKDQPLGTGAYFIESKLSSTKAFDVAGGQTNNSTKVQLYQKNYSVAQKWNFHYDANTGYYLIIGRGSNKALDVKDGSTKPGSNLQIYGDNGTCAQRWRISKINDTYEFLSSCSDMAIDIPNANPINNTNLQIWQRNNTDAQKWRVSEINKANLSLDTSYVITTKLSQNKTLDVAGGQTNNSTKVQLYQRNNTDAQKWRVSYDDNTNYYQIRNSGSNKMLDVAGGGVLAGTRLQIYNNNGTCAQKWVMNKQSDGSFELLSACSNLAVDSKDGSFADGTAIQVFNRNNTPAQRWIFNEI